MEHDQGWVSFIETQIHAGSDSGAKCKPNGFSCCFDVTNDNRNVYLLEMQWYFLDANALKMTLQTGQETLDVCKTSIVECA